MRKNEKKTERMIIGRSTKFKSKRPCMHSKLKTISSEVRRTSEKEPFL